MKPMIPVSCGELIDKITILEIKARRLTTEDARVRVIRELSTLCETALALGLSDDVFAMKIPLQRVNEALWDAEAQLRDHEDRQDFGAEFVSLARAVYRHNDERASIKRLINALAASELVEEKDYQT